MKAMKSLTCLAIAAAALAPMGCTPAFVETSEADVILRITRLIGQPGSEDQDDGDVLFSDTCCAIINDNIGINVEVITKSGLPTTVIGQFNDVTLERYEVRYVRTDGRNVEGLDVPFAISGPLASVRVAADGQAAVSVVGVRHQAKLEPPLKNLEGKFGGDSGALLVSGAGIVTTLGEVTIHGRTTSGKAVTAFGRIEIVFADFAGEG
jgi:hypothetical protein